MRRFRIFHETEYEYPHNVQLGPHKLIIRPRDGHDVRIEESRLDLAPQASITWHRDELDNSIALAVFPDTATQHLRVTSEVIVTHYLWTRTTAEISRHISRQPENDNAPEANALAAYQVTREDPAIKNWLDTLQLNGSDSLDLLQNLALAIHEQCEYEVRLEEGVQAPAVTLARRQGSCRDYAWLFVEAARCSGFAARFVSGYFYTAGTAIADGHTHAWAEVYLPGAGWTGFDPTSSVIVGENHIPVAVAVVPEAIPPISGSFTGPKGPAPAPKVRVRITEA